MDTLFQCLFNTYFISTNTQRTLCSLAFSAAQYSFYLIYCFRFEKRHLTNLTSITRKGFLCFELVNFISQICVLPNVFLQNNVEIMIWFTPRYCAGFAEETTYLKVYTGCYSFHQSENICWLSTTLLRRRYGCFAKHIHVIVRSLFMQVLKLSPILKCLIHH